MFVLTVFLMPRTARIVLPDHPHHITQRGNRRQPVFFREDDYRLYRSILKEEAQEASVGIWAYCLMPNHVHVMAVPREETGLARAFKETHRRYTRIVNNREGWTGYLWQGRFSSFAMTEKHAVMAMRYIENNPVAAGLVQQAEDYMWSSARHHVGLREDVLVSKCFLQESIKDWREYLVDGLRPDMAHANENLILSHLKNGDTLK